VSDTEKITNPFLEDPDLDSLTFGDLPVSVWEGAYSMDYDAWQDVSMLDALQKSAAAIDQEIGSPTRVMRDGFVGLYDDLTRLAQSPPEEMPLEHRLFEHISELPEWQHLRDTVAGDDLASAMATAHFSRQMVANLPESVKEQIKKANDAQQQAQHIQNHLDAFSELARSGSNLALEQQMQELLNQLPQADQQAQAAVQQALAAMGDAKARIEQAAAQAIDRAGQQVADTKQAAGEFGFGWGVGGGGEGSRNPIEALDKLAAFMSKAQFIHEILKMLGWAKALVSDVKRRSRHGYIYFSHIGPGELRPSRLADEEYLGLLADPRSAVGLDWAARGYDDDLMHQHWEGEDEGGQGPLVYVYDTSGSMKQNNRYIVSAALMIALLQQAIKESRRFIAIPFSGTGQFKVVDLGTQPDPWQLLELAEFGYWGNTDPYPPVEAAIELIKTDPSLKKGDVFVTTDGAFGLPSEAFLKLVGEVREKPGIKTVVVTIGGTHAQTQGWADKSLHLEDLYQQRERLQEAVGVLYER
jgi:uncharacterized protein with von Willebrand factor type A (vWA) domain